MSQGLTSYKLEKYQKKLQSVSQNHPSYQVYLSKYMYYLQGGGIEMIVQALQQYSTLIPPPEPASSRAKFAFNAKKIAKIAQIKALLNTHGCMIASLSHDKIINLISFGAELTLENIQTTLGCTSLGQKTTGAVQATRTGFSSAVTATQQGLSRVATATQERLSRGAEFAGTAYGNVQRGLQSTFVGPFTTGRVTANPPSNPGN